MVGNSSFLSKSYFSMYVCKKHAFSCPKFQMSNETAKIEANETGLCRALYDSAYPYVYDSAGTPHSVGKQWEKKLFFLKSRYTETAFIEITALRTRRLLLYVDWLCARRTTYNFFDMVSEF